MVDRKNILSIFATVGLHRSKIVLRIWIIQHESVGLKSYNFIKIYPCYYKEHKGVLPVATQEFIRIAEKSSNSSILKVTFNIKSPSEVRLF